MIRRLFQFYTCMNILCLLLWAVQPNINMQRLISIAFLSFFDILFFGFFRKCRTKKLKKVARNMDLEFYETDKDRNLIPVLEGFPFFEEIRPRTRNILNDFFQILDVLIALVFLIRGIRKLKNILIRQENQTCFYAIFDFYSYKWSFSKSQKNALSSSWQFTSSGGLISNQSQTMMIINCQNLNLPEFSVKTKQKTILCKIFESVRKLFIRQITQSPQVFNSKINDFYRTEKNLCIAAEKDLLICYRNNILIKPKKIESFESTGLKALDLFRKTDSISYEIDFEYPTLRNLLEERKWQEADQETTAILLKQRVRKVEDTNTVILIKDIFLDRVLHRIDALWQEHSDGRFGFRVQKEIWSELGEKVDYKTECLLADRVGWRVQGRWLYYSDLTFSLNAPQGHLPTTELSEQPLGWFYMCKRPLFKIPGGIGLPRFIALPGCFIASKL